MWYLCGIERALYIPFLSLLVSNLIHCDTSKANLLINFALLVFQCPFDYTLFFQLTCINFMYSFCALSVSYFLMLMIKIITATIIAPEIPLLHVERKSCSPT